MNARDIIIEWLKQHGYDGLCNNTEDGCGCGIDNLFPCEACPDNCVPSYRVPVPEDEDSLEWYSTTKPDTTKHTILTATVFCDRTTCVHNRKDINEQGDYTMSYCTLGQIRIALRGNEYSVCQSYKSKRKRKPKMQT